MIYSFTVLTLLTLQEMEQSGIPPGDLSTRRQSSWSVLFASCKEMTAEFRGLLIAISSCWMISLIFDIGKPCDWHGEKVTMPFGGRTTLMFMITASWMLIFGASCFFIHMCCLAFKNNEISYNGCFDNGICLLPIRIAGQNHLLPNRVWLFQLRNQWYLVVFWLLHCKLLLFVYFVCSVL